MKKRKQIQKQKKQRHQLFQTISSLYVAANFMQKKIRNVSGFNSLTNLIPGHKNSKQKLCKNNFTQFN